MASRLVNVRLDEARLEKARQLRERGVSVSDLVRNAIDAQYATLIQGLTGLKAEAALRRILEEHPDPAGLPDRTYDVHDAHEARDAVRRRHRRRRPGR